MREHNEAVNRLDFMLARASEITADYAPGERAARSQQHDGSTLRLRKLARRATTRPTASAAMNYLQAAPRRRRDRHRAAVLPIRTATDLHDAQNTVDAPLNALSDAELVPGSAALATLNAALR